MENKIIVFDMDGVIIDSVELMADLTQRRYPGSTLQEEKDLFLGNIHEQIKFLNEKYGSLGIEENKKILFDYTSNKIKNVQLYPGIKELLSSLSVRYSLIINSSAATRNATPILERYNLLEFFDRVFLKEDSISKTEKFKMIAEHYAVSPSALLFVTDTVGDVREAAELSIDTIAVTYGVHTQEYFNKYPCSNLIMTVGSVTELGLAIDKYYKQK
jgi:phosphoglycolate phosphatase-like HAD superfamily hydrolase